MHPTSGGQPLIKECKNFENQQELSQNLKYKKTQRSLQEAIKKTTPSPLAQKE
jgi:hypothetical protein